jgi:hypothetical protein
MALESMARNIDFLGQGLLQVTRTVDEQWKLLDAQGDLLAGEGSRPEKLAILKDLRASKQAPPALRIDVERRSPAPTTVATAVGAGTVSTVSPVSAPTAAGSKRGEGLKLSPRDVYGDFSDAEDEGSALGADATEDDEEDEMLLVKSNPSSPRALGLSQVKVEVPVDENRLTALLSKYYKGNVFDRVKGLVTRSGVTIHDCIASGSIESGSLELFAGDYESYSLFSPLFDPVIKACHPHFKDNQVQPIDLNYRHLDGLADPDPTGEHVKKARLVVSRNVAGYNLTPKMSVQQLREVEKLVVSALRTLTGRLKGTYTSMKAVMKDRALQEDLERAELPQTYR